jgi:hypothetical protein
MEDFMVTVEGLEMVSRESRIEIVLPKKKSLEVHQPSIYTYTSILPPSPASVTRASRNSPTPNMHPRLFVWYFIPPLASLTPLTRVHQRSVLAGG